MSSKPKDTTDPKKASATKPIPARATVVVPKKQPLVAPKAAVIPAPAAKAAAVTPPAAAPAAPVVPKMPVVVPIPIPAPSANVTAPSPAPEPKKEAEPAPKPEAAKPEPKKEAEPTPKPAEPAPTPAKKESGPTITKVDMGPEITSLTPEQKETYTNAFKKFDSESRGRMPQADLQTLMSSIGFKVDDQQAQEMIQVADSNNTGTIELNEFLKLMVGALRNKNTKHEYARKFQIFDRNNDGYITEADIRRVTEALGVNLYPDQIAALIKQADKNKDGRISYKEYTAYMVDGKNINKYWKSTDEMLSSLNNLWLITDDPQALQWDNIRSARYWDVDRYQEAYLGILFLFIFCLLFPKLYRKCFKPKNYEQQEDENQGVEIEMNQ